MIEVSRLKVQEKMMQGTHSRLRVGEQDREHVELGNSDQARRRRQRRLRLVLERLRERDVAKSLRVKRRWSVKDNGEMKRLGMSAYLFDLSSEGLETGPAVLKSERRGRGNVERRHAEVC